MASLIFRKRSQFWLKNKGIYMDHLSEFLLGLMTIIVVGIFKFFQDKINGLNSAVRELNREIHQLNRDQSDEVTRVKVKLSEQYTTKEEFQRVISKLFDKVDENNKRIESHVERLNAKIDVKFDEILKRLDRDRERELDTRNNRES